MTESQQNTKIAGDIVLYGLGGVLSQAAGLITLPLIVRTLTAVEYGTIETISAATGYFSLLIGLNILYGVYRYYYEYEKDLNEQQKIVSTAIFFTFFCGIILALFAFPLSSRLSQNLFQSDKNRQFILMSFFAMIPMAIYNYTLGLLRLKRQALAYILSSLAVSLMYLFSIVIFIDQLRLGIRGFYYAQILSYGLGIVITMFLSRELLTFSISLNWLKRLAKYSIPLVPSTFFIWSIGANTRLFLNTYTDAARVAYYVFASKLSFLVTLFTQAFNSAWEPTKYSLLNNEEQLKKKLPSILSIYTFTTFAVSIFLLVIAREAYLLLAPPEYLIGIGLLGIIGVRWLFTIGVCIIDPGTAKTGKTYLVSLALGIAVVINMIANRLLLPTFGIEGAAVAELIGFAVAMIIRWLISNHLFPIHWDVKYFVMSLGVYALIAVTITRVTLSNLPIIWSVALRFILLIGFIFIEFYLLDRNSRRELVSTIQSFATRLQRFTSREKK
ncbi:MAG: polysaccharide biosynthesis protein [Chloroflexi bacterium]|nr:polysaccharide biosynthesis protein [Chloroflexota bacterium]